MPKKLVNLVLLLVLATVLNACSAINCEECTESDIRKLDKIGSGDYAAYKRFMKKHPDPEFICIVLNSGINAVSPSTKSEVVGSGNLKIIKDFFTYDLSQKMKNEILESFWGDDEDELVRFLIEQGARLERYNYCAESFLPGLKQLHKLGYDMNYVDPETGRNIFLDYSKMGYEKDNFKGGDCAVECLKYLESIGVDTNIKDAEGKTALEIASDSTIIEYLKSI